MARRTKLVLAAIGLGAVAVALVPLAFATSLAPTGRVSAASLNPVGGSGVRGQSAAQERIEAESFKLHVTLACKQACATGPSGSGIPVRVVFTEGRCGTPAGKRYPVGAGTMGPGGLDLRREHGFDPNDDPISNSRAVRVRWDPDGDGKFEQAACGRDHVIADTTNQP